MPNSHSPLNRSSARGNHGKTALACGAWTAARAPQRRDENKQQDECVEDKRDPAERLRGDDGERERREDALAVQIAVIVDRVRIGMLGAVQRCNQLQTGRNGRIACARGRLGVGARNARRNRLSRAARVVLQERRQHEAVVPTETRDLAACDRGPRLLECVHGVRAHKLFSDHASINERRAEGRGEKRAHRDERREQRARIESRRTGHDVAREREEITAQRRLRLCGRSRSASDASACPLCLLAAAYQLPAAAWAFADGQGGR